jgi:16S rRNA (guanine966-N2)-methyltransferase
MRVIAGSAGGRRLVVPDGEVVRPTTDRVKEAWFSSLHPRLPGAAVLDLWAGSGALGLEAASRGAGRVVAVERDRRALAALQDNVATTGLAVEVVAAVLPGALAGLVGPFDIVVGDPPYRIDPDELAVVLAGLPPLLAPGAEVWLETARRSPAPRWPAPLLHDRSRRYGDTTLHRAVVPDDVVDHDATGDGSDTAGDDGGSR